MKALPFDSRRTRHGMAMEVLLASALLIAAIVPIYSLIGSSQQIAYLDEFQVLSRRRGFQALSLLSGHRPRRLLEASREGSLSEGRHPRLSPDAREVYLPLPQGGLDMTLENIPAEAQEYYLSRVSRVPVRAFVEELEPGLIRISVLVTWADPISKTGRSLLVSRLEEGAFPWVTP